MAQFDIHRNADPSTRALFPYLVDLQADLLSSLNTRVVAPLATTRALPKPASRLNPAFVIDGRTLALSTPELAGVPRAALGPVVGSAAGRRDELIGALDLLFKGV